MTDRDRALLELAARAAGMVNYNPITGSMTWKQKPKNTKDSARWNSRYSGKECGTVDDKGYRRILFRFQPDSTFKIRVHRLAWFIVYGVIPFGEIDHINQIKTDNRIENLRDVPKSINQRNVPRRVSNTSGVPGVTWHKQRAKWCAQASVDGKHHHIGLFTAIEDAEKAAKEFRAAHGFSEIHGRAIVRAAAELGKQIGR